MGVDIGELAVKEETTLEALSGKRIVIDGNNALYQFLSIIRQRDGTLLMDSKGRVTSHLSGLFYRTARLVEAGVRPIYVFDGEPPKMKRRVLEERREARAEAHERWMAALQEGALREARTYATASSQLTQEMIAEAKHLLEIMGIPAIQAPQEGEAQGAYMCARGDAWASASQDYDSLLLGAPRLLRNLTISGRRKLPRREEYVEIVPELIELERMLKELGITREQLIWIGILVGTDFNKGVKGIGPKKALKLVKECRSLGEIVKKFEGEFEVEPADVEDYFLHPKVAERYDIAFHAPERERIVRFLCEEHDFSPERVENAVRSYISAMHETMEQSKLGEWFG